MNTTNADSFRAAIDRCLDEFDDLWDQGRKPRADRFRDRFDDSTKSDFVELVYQEFCRAEADGLNPRPDEFLDHYAEFRAPLEKLFAVHFGLEPDSPKPITADVEPASDDLPVPGDCIGPYRLTRILGQGGMGRVFLAAQTDLADRPVVLKIVRIGSSVEPEHQARVDDPNVMPVFRHFRTDDGRFLAIVMPWIPGLSVDKITVATARKPRRARSGRTTAHVPDEPNAEVVSESEPVEVLVERLKDLRFGRRSSRGWNRQVGAWGASLARALYAAYQRGIVHGDVKPGNIHIGTDLQPYLLDFHLSRRWKFDRHMAVFEHDDAGGTLFYMSPERLDLLADRLKKEHRGTLSPRHERARYAHRGDLYSLALVLLEVLTGNAPGSVDTLDPTSLADAARTLAEKRRNPLWCRTYPGFSRLPADWRKTLEQALDPDPAQRHADGTEFAARLDRATSEIDGSSRLRKALRSRSLRAATAAGLTILTGTIIWTANREYQREKQLAALVWRTPYEFWDDPSSFQTNTPARRLATGRAELDRLSGLVLKGSPWPFDPLRILPRDARLDADLWLADRVEHLSRSLAQRALRTDDARDAASALDLLAVGSSHWRCEAWDDRERTLRKKFDLPRAGIPVSATGSPLVTEYVDRIAAESADPEFEFRKWQALAANSPDSFAVQWGFARFLAANGRVPAAIQALRQALSVDPDHFEARRLLAQMSFRNRNFETAIEEIEAALERRHDDISALRIRSILRLYVGQREELMAEIDRMGEILRTEEEPEAEEDAGKAFAETSASGSRKGGVEILDTRTVERIHELFPKDREVTTLLVKKYYRDKRVGDAIALMESLVRTGPRKTQDLINLAILYRNDFQNAKAIELGMEIVNRNDFGDWINKRKAVRNFFFKILKELEAQDRTDAIKFCTLLLNASNNNTGNKGLWHYQLARLHLVEFKDGGINTSIEHLKLAGRQHKAYIEEWYSTDRTFDEFRDTIDAELNQFFRSIGSLKNDRNPNPTSRP